MKSENQKSVINNIKTLYESQEMFVKLFENYFRIVFEAKFRTKHGKGLKILTPKQIVQRLRIVLAQVKAGSTSENLFNEIRQIIHFLYRAKEISKKVYNNITNTINA